MDMERTTTPYVASPDSKYPPVGPSAVTTTEPRRPHRRKWVGKLLIGAVALAVFGAYTIPIPYVVTTPGPTVDLNAEFNGHEIISITGKDPKSDGPVTLDPSHEGQLRMVTISEYGGPGHSVTLADVLTLMSDGVSEIERYADVYGAEVTADQVQSFSQALMTSSHSTSTVAALEAIGWDVPAVVTITGAVPESDAEGKVREGDVLVSATMPDGTVHPITRAGTIFAVMASQPGGSKVELLVKRDGKDTPLTITSRPSPDGVGSKLGIYLDIQTTPPVDVSFEVEDIGGPSAGMMFALAIIDKLTPGDLTGGKNVAGTGAISYDGRIEPIGGLAQKIAGARNDGAEYFLAPTLNCEELESVPSGIEVYRVDTLSQALEMIKAISEGNTQGLPACVAR